jgi:ATP-dependent RNA circularization protein (DNA/RNA ligase family)
MTYQGGFVILNELLGEDNPYSDDGIMSFENVSSFLSYLNTQISILF